MILTTTAFRVSDPGTPAELGGQFLPHDATRIRFELWFETDLPVRPEDFTVIVERKGGLGGVQWRPVAVIGTTKLELGLLTYDIVEMPPQITASDRHGSYRTRFKVIASHAGDTQEILVDFGRSQLPVFIDRRTIRIFDPDRPESPSASDPVLASDIRRLGIEFVPTGDIETFTVTLQIRGESPGVHWKVVTPGRRNEPVSVVIDPLPAKVVAPTTSQSPNRYFLDIVIAAGDYTSSENARFWLGPTVPQGSLAIRDVVLAKHPDFTVASTAVSYSDLWERAVVSIAIATTGYDPTKESSPAVARAFFTDKGPSGKRWQASAEVIFDDDGTGWAFVDQSTLPPLDEDGEKQLHIHVSHAGRVAMRTFERVPTTTGFRADRVIDIRRAVIVAPDGAESSDLSPISKTVRVDARVFRSNGGPVVTLCLALFPRRRRASTVYTGASPKALAFRLIQTTGEGIEDVTLDFALPGLTAELFKFGHVAVKLALAYETKGTRRWNLQETGEFTALGSAAALEEKAQPMAVSTSSRPRPKPPISSIRLSGKHWCKPWPTSTDPAALTKAFAKRVTAFIAMLRANGARVDISATFRPTERAYLMHFAWRIGSGELRPGRVPSLKGVDIVWNHDRAMHAAQEMVATYRIVYPPAYPTRHQAGEAIDMTISNLPETLAFTHDGKPMSLPIGKAEAHLNRKLWALADTCFDVIKLPSDRPHWEAR